MGKNNDKKRIQKASKLKKITTIINRIIIRSTSESNEVERYYFKYNQYTALSSIWVAHYLIYKKFIQIAEEEPTLDLCCGSGAGTKMISEFTNNKVIGIDYSYDAINYAKRSNKNSLIDYYKLDLNKKLDISHLSILIRKYNLKQVFLIEGIEHLKFSNFIIKTLLENGVSRIFISTPFIHKIDSNKYHINQFTESKYAIFQKKFNSTILSYCKPVEIPYITHLLKTGISEKEIMNRYFTNNCNHAGNYLIEIDCRNNKKKGCD